MDKDKSTGRKFSLEKIIKGKPMDPQMQKAISAAEGGIMVFLLGILTAELPSAKLSYQEIIICLESILFMDAISVNNIKEYYDALCERKRIPKDDRSINQILNEAKQRLKSIEEREKEMGSMLSQPVEIEEGAKKVL